MTTTKTIPRGYVHCELCGEFNGETEARNLNIGIYDYAPDTLIRVTCICNGAVCKKCGVNMRYRPGSNTYFPDDNSVWHTPVMAGMAPCAECQRKAKQERLAEEQETGGDRKAGRR